MTAELAASYASVEETVRVRTAELALLQRVAVAANEAANPAEAQPGSPSNWSAATPAGRSATRCSSTSPTTGRRSVVSARVLAHADDRERYLAGSGRPPKRAAPAGRASAIPGKVLAAGAGGVGRRPGSDRSPRSPSGRARPERRAADGMTFPVLIGRDVVAMLEFFSPSPSPPDASARLAGERRRHPDRPGDRTDAGRRRRCGRPRMRPRWPTRPRARSWPA